jgi:uncharacterized membrane protein YkoI
MRLVITIILLAAAALVPLRSEAFVLEGAPKADVAQYEPLADLRVTKDDGMSLSEAIESVRSRTGGRVVSAETKIEGDREVHHIKVLTKDGKVRTHKVNGRRR